MSDAVDPAELIALAHAGDNGAFTRLVAQVEPEWRLVAATFCGSLGQCDAALRCAVVSLRAALGECPTGADAFAPWYQDLILRHIDRLLALAQRPGSGEDALTRLGTASGLDALRRDAVAALAASRAFAARLGTLSDAERHLLTRRYAAHQVTADALPELMRLRAALLEAPGPAAEVAAAWENALASSKPAVREAVVAAADEDARSMLRDQLRAHLLLTALLAPPDAARTQQFAATVGFTPESAYPEAQRGATQDGASTQLAAPITFSVQDPTPRKMTTRSNRPVVRTGNRRPPESVAVPLDPPTPDAGFGDRDDEEDFERSQRRTNYLMWGTIGVIAIIATIAVTWQSRSSDIAAEGPRATEAAVGIATVLSFNGQVQEIRLDRQRQPMKSGAVLSPGQGLVVTGSDSAVTVRLEGVGQMTTRGEVIIHSIVTDPHDPQSTLINLNAGSLDIEAMKPRPNGRLSVNTNHGRMTSPGMAGEVRCLDRQVTVTVRDGEARLSGIEDPRQAVLIAGLSATAGNGGRAVCEAPRRFMRGVNLGGEATPVAGQRWLSQDQARQHGLTVVAGAMQRGGASSTSRLDPALRAMLDTGLAGDATGSILLTQKLPPALWEIDLWLANDQGYAGRGLVVLIDGRQVPLGQPQAKGATWRAMGPLGTVVRGDQVEVRVQGLAAGDRLTGIAFRLLGKVPDHLGPAFASLPPWSAAADLGGLLGQWWDRLKGNGLSSLVNDPRYPQAPIREALLTTSRIPMAEESWSGHRLVGFIHPPVTGEYVFSIVADGNAELLLGNDDQHLHVRRIAHVPRSVKPDEWSRYREQTSAPIRLVAGERYAVEVVHRENDRNTHLAIGWRRPDGSEERPIPGSCLSPLRPPLKP